MRFLSARQVVLSFALEGAAADAPVRLWRTADTGRSWQAVEATRVHAGAVRVEVEQDGRYSFYLAAAAAPDAPPRGALPHATVVIDTVEPMVQIHAASVAPAALGAERRLRLRLTVIEENLHEDGVRLLYRPAETRAWRDGGVLACAKGAAEWPIPADAPARIDLRVVVTDRAGNRSFAELIGVPAGDARGSPASAPPAGDSLASSSAGSIEADVEPSRETTPVTGAAAAQPAIAPAAMDPTCESLRALAAHFASEGRFELAAARLRDALERCPGHADLLSDLGHLLVRTGRFDQAAEAFESALVVAADHRTSIEGMALVAVHSKRYAEAQRWLRELVRLEPASAQARLHLGDVSFQLGQRDEALREWDAVLALPGADRDSRERARRRIDQLAPPAEKPRSPWPAPQPPPARRSP